MNLNSQICVTITEVKEALEALPPAAPVPAEAAIPPQPQPEPINEADYVSGFIQQTTIL